MRFALCTLHPRFTFLAFAFAGTLFRILGEPFLRLAARIVGIVLFAIAVDFVLDGLQVVFDS